eukprot:m.52861 g.52861  ORF g.52861 m.52861 type:complete len:100 (+) comp12735_c2_seq3:114-413(+)
MGSLYVLPLSRETAKDLRTCQAGRNCVYYRAGVDGRAAADVHGDGGSPVPSLDRAAGVADCNGTAVAADGDAVDVDGGMVESLAWSVEEEEGGDPRAEH